MAESSNQAFVRSLMASPRLSPSSNIPGSGSFTLAGEIYQAVSPLSHLLKSPLPAGKTSDIFLMLSPTHTVPVRGQCQRIPNQVNLADAYYFRQIWADLHQIQVLMYREQIGVRGHNFWRIQVFRERLRRRGHCL